MNFRQLGRTWVIAEIGVNHEGDFDVACSLIEKAALAGADAVKFQTYQVDNYISIVQPERLERLRKFQLSQEEIEQLARIAKEKGLVFFSTPFSLEDVDSLDQIVPLYKVASGELTYLDLIRHVATKNKPIILSTGLGLEKEIQVAIDTVLSVRHDAGEKGELMLMHCVSAYPTPNEEAQLANIRWLKDRFGLPVGYSDHTLGTKASELAVAVGAVALEKHFTYRKEDQEFRDHLISADPDDLQELVTAVRQVEIFLGQYERVRGEAEMGNFVAARRSVAAAAEIPAGVPIRREWLTGLRPLPVNGVPAEEIENVIGKVLKRTVSIGDLILRDDLNDQ